MHPGIFLSLRPYTYSISKSCSTSFDISQESGPFSPSPPLPPSPLTWITGMISTPHSCHFMTCSPHRSQNYLLKKCNPDYFTQNFSLFSIFPSVKSRLWPSGLRLMWSLPYFPLLFPLLGPLQVAGILVFPRTQGTAPTKGLCTCWPF